MNHGRVNEGCAESVGSTGSNQDDRCQQALTAIRNAVARIAQEEGGTIKDVLDVYWIASNSGAFHASDEDVASAACSAVRTVGSGFLQLAEAAERYQDSPGALESWMNLIREAATSWLNDGTSPAWSDRGGPYPDRS